jgi:CRP/FNR family cyclic AMP-dependent transcriptional regulator
VVGKRDLGKVFKDGELLCKQGEPGDRMYVIQKGRVEVLVGSNGKETRLNIVGKGAVIGEMAVFEKLPRSATVRALGEVRALTVDKKNLLRRVSEDPSLAFQLIRALSKRVRELSDEIARLRG